MHAASFDCSRATAPVEHLICDFPRLDALDTEMGALYSFMRSGQSSQVREQLRQEQIAWLNARYGACGIPRSGTVPPNDQDGMALCLEQLLYMRLEQMRIWLGPAGRAFDREFKK